MGFLGTPDGRTRGRELGWLVPFGVAILFLSVVADAFVSNIQHRLFRRPVDPDDPMVLMFRTNLLEAAAVGLSPLVTPSGPRMAEAVADYPLIPAYLAVIGCCLAAGVWALTTLIGERGAVLAIYVATVRKVVTVELSCFTFPKPITALHGLSGVLVLIGLVLGDAAQRAQQRRKEEGRALPASHAVSLLLVYA